MIYSDGGQCHPWKSLTWLLKGPFHSTHQRAKRVKRNGKTTKTTRLCPGIFLFALASWFQQGNSKWRTEEALSLQVCNQNPYQRSFLTNIWFISTSSLLFWWLKSMKIPWFPVKSVSFQGERSIGLPAIDHQTWKLVFFVLQEVSWFWGQSSSGSHQ